MKQVNLRKSLIIDKHISHGISIHTEKFHNQQHEEVTVPLNRRNTPKVIAAMILENKELHKCASKGGDTTKLFDLKVELVSDKKQLPAEEKRKMTFSYNLYEDQDKLNAQLIEFKESFEPSFIQKVGDFFYGLMPGKSMP